MKKLYLHNFHENSGANFKRIRDTEIPSDYGNVENELFSANNTVALLDRSYLGKVKMIGKDSLDLLNRISTNDLQYLAVGTVLDTVFATPKGRLIDYCRIINSENHEYILVSSFINTDHLLDWVNRFIILEDAEIKDVSNDFIWLTLLGPHAKIFLYEFTDVPISEADEAIWLNCNNIIIPALKNNNFKTNAYNFCIERKHAEAAIEIFQNTLNQLDGSLIGDTAFQIIRVESGMPDWGTEITQDYNPHEARLLKAVSFTKGCYTGQEIIARLDTYDKVQKYLMIVDLFEKIEDHTQLEIYIEDEFVGYLTSHIFNPLTQRSMGLGYIKKMFTTENDIYVEVLSKSKRIGAKLRKPPQAY